jgi:probable HAF family extracellular repeat protein
MNARYGNLLWLLLLLPGVFGLQRPVLAQAYYVVDLGTLGSTNSIAISVNNHGQVAGFYYTSNYFEHAFLYSGGAMTDLGTLGGTNILAAHINDSGQIVGACNTTGEVAHAFLYMNGKMTDLGTLGGSNSLAACINNSGQIIGVSDTTNMVGPRGVRQAFLYSGGVMTNLITSNSSNNVTAMSINSSGQIIGNISESSGILEPYLYSSGVVTDLGNIISGGRLEGINDSGQIVGEYTTGTGSQKVTHGFLLNTNGTWTDVGSFGGNTGAYGINNNGQVVGYSTSIGGQNRAYIYSGGTMTDLNTQIATNSGWVLNVAYGINDLGQICGAGTISSQTNAFLLTPVSLAPILTITLSGTNVVLSWPTNASGFALEAATNLPVLSPAGWNTNQPGPAVINGQYSVTTPHLNTLQFIHCSSIACTGDLAAPVKKAPR